jgi:hypothetical protein
MQGLKVRGVGTDGTLQRLFPKAPSPRDFSLDSCFLVGRTDIIEVYISCWLLGLCITK